MKCPFCGEWNAKQSTICVKCGRYLLLIDQHSLHNYTLVDYFKANLSNWFSEVKECDCMTYLQHQKHNNKYLPKYRQNFGIGLDAEILFTRDTSWSCYNQGLVITNQGIYVIKDNSNSLSSRSIILWNSFDQVVYKEGDFLFYDQNGDYKLSLNNNYFFKSISSELLETEIGPKLADHLTKMAQLDGLKIRKNEVFKLRDAFPSIIDSLNIDRENYIKKLQQELGNVNDSPELKAILYCTLAAAYKLTGRHNDALDAIDKSLKLNDDDNTHVIKGVLMGKGRNVYDVYVAMQELLHYKAMDREEMVFYTKDQISDKFFEFQSYYSQNFLSIPVNQRKHLVICDELVYLPQSFMVLPLSELPTDIKFPTGYPINDTLYIRHPYKSDTYFPYDSYDIEILRDEICEFTWIMDCLGAKHIDFIDTVDDGVENTEHTRRDIHGHGDYAGQYGGNFGHESEKRSEEYRKLHNELGQSKDFEPGSTPRIPCDVVWYSHRIDWQRKCQSRLEGRLLHDTFALSVSVDEMISDTEKKKIEADMKILLLKAGGGTEGEKSFSLKKEHAHTWKVNVDFHSMSVYDKKNVQTVSVLPNNILTTSETPKRKFNSNWIFGLIIAVLAAIILCLLLL